MRQFVVSSLSRRIVMGLAIGVTVIAIVISPLGKQSVGHFNPAITFTSYRLGKVAFWDASVYAAGQFLGAIAGVVIAAYVVGRAPGRIGKAADNALEATFLASDDARWITGQVCHGGQKANVRANTGGYCVTPTTF